MASIRLRQDILKTLIDKIVEESKSIYEEEINPNALIEGWARQVKRDLGLNSYPSSHAILRDEFKSRLLHSKLHDFRVALPRDYDHGGVFKNRRRDQHYVLLAEWEPQHLLEGVEFFLERRALVQMIRAHIARVECVGRNAKLDQTMLDTWKSMSERVFITEVYVLGWDGVSSTKYTAVDVESEQEYERVDEELRAFVRAIRNNEQLKVWELVPHQRSDGTMRHFHEFLEHWTAEAILENAKAHNRSRSSSPSNHSQVALSLSQFSARTRQHS